MTVFIIIEREMDCDLAIEYPTTAAAEEALENSIFIDDLVETDCLDSYISTGPPDLAEVIHPPASDGIHMCAEQAAEAHAKKFSYHQGDPELAPEQSRYLDLVALLRETFALTLEQRDLLGFYDSEDELLGRESPTIKW